MTTSDATGIAGIRVKLLFASLFVTELVSVFVCCGGLFNSEELVATLFVFMPASRRGTRFSPNVFLKIVLRDVTADGSKFHFSAASLVGRLIMSKSFLVKSSHLMFKVGFLAPVFDDLLFAMFFTI